MTVGRDERRQRNRERVREDILEAAARAFVEAGYRNATMQDIAREAGYTAASLYTYFKSKEEILAGLFELVRDDLARGMDEPLPEGLTFAQRFEIAFTRQMRLIEERKDVFLTFLSLVPGKDFELPCPGSDSSIHPIVVRIRQVAEWLRRNATPEDLGGHTPEDVACLVVGTTFAFVHRWAFGGTRERLPDQVPVMLDLILGAISSNRRRTTP